MVTSSNPSFFRRHAKKMTFIFLAIAVLGAVLAYRPALAEFKSRRAVSLIEEAREFAAAEDWKEVERTARASLQNEPSSLEALRLFATALVKTDDPRSLAPHYSLFKHPEALPADRAMALEHVLASGDLDTVSQMIGLLSDEEKKIPVIRYQVVHWLLLSGQLKDAIVLADEFSIIPRDPSLDLLLAKGIARSKVEGARVSTATRLQSVMKGRDRDLALEALTFLSSLPDAWINGSLAEAALIRFQNDPDLSASHRLDLEFLKLGLRKAGGDQTDKTVERVISEYQEDHLPELVRWLKRIGRLKRIVELTESESAKSTKDVFSDRLNALEKLELWEILDEELENPPVFIPEPLLFSAQAIAAFQIGNQLKFIQCWRDAVDAAVIDLEQNWFYQLATSARHLQDMERQMEALAQGILHPMAVPPNSSQLTDLFQWLLDRDETERFLKITEVLLRREPQNPLLINNNLYLKALHKKVNSEDVAQLRLLVKAYPENTGMKDSLALVLLQNGEPQDALDVLREISPDPLGLSPSNQAVFAKALYALGKEEEALKMAGDIPWKKLSQAERRLLALARPEEEQGESK